MSKKRLEEGDIFYVEQQEKYFFGKILLDVNERILKIESENILSTFSGCYLVAIYKGIYDNPELTSREFIIPSAFTLKKYFYSRKYRIDWKYYDKEPIDYKQLNYPESLVGHGGKGIYFTKGELELKTDLTREEYYNEYEVLKTIHNSYYSLIDIACHYQQRDDLMDLVPTHYLEKSDLRFAQEKRIEVYKKIGEDMNQSYYDMALKHGLDMGRFYS